MSIYIYIYGDCHPADLVKGPSDESAMAVPAAGDPGNSLPADLASKFEWKVCISWQCSYVTYLMRWASNMA